MKKLIFDFDGTLVDSMKQWAGKMLYVLNRNGISYPEDIIKTITPLGDIGAATYFVEELGLNLPINEIIRQMDDFALVEYTYKIPAKATVIDTLKLLKKERYSLNVLTASPHRMLDVCLKRLGIFGLFDYVWSCEDFETTKSDVNIYHMVAKQLNTDTGECIFFDDNINALVVAKEAGMKVVGVFDESSAEYEKEIRSICDWYIVNFEDILQKGNIS